MHILLRVDSSIEGRKLSDDEGPIAVISRQKGVSPIWGTDSAGAGTSALLIRVSGTVAGITDLGGRGRE